MKDKDKRKEQLINELVEMRRKVAELEASEDDRKQVERELRESEERFRRFAEEASFEGIFFHDKGRILDVNQQFVTLYGYNRAELIGMEVLEFITPESREIVLRHIQEGREKAYEAVGLKKDGSTVPVEIHAKTIPFHGKMVKVAAVRDLTERKLAEEVLREVARQRLQSSNIIAHELRNTLTKFGLFFSVVNLVMSFLREQWEFELRKAFPRLEDKNTIIMRLNELIFLGQPHIRDQEELMQLSKELLAEQKGLANLFLLPQQGIHRLYKKISPKWRRLLAESRAWEKHKEEVQELLKRLEKAIWVVVDEDLAKKIHHLPEDLLVEWRKLAYTQFSANNLSLLGDVFHLLEHPALNIRHRQQLEKLLTSLKVLADIISIVEERTNRIVLSLKSSDPLEEV